MNLKVAPEIRRALQGGRPVVALESTIITHGMPYPENLETAHSLESQVRAGGAIPATIAVMGGVKAELDVGQLLFRRLTIAGSTLRSRPVAFKAAIAGQLHERVWPLIASGRIRPVIAHVYPAAQAAQAHTLMESNQHIGKIVLDWTS